jgi:hypothetical protein
MIGKPVKAAQKQAMGNFRGNTFITDPKAFRAAAEADTQKKLASLTAEQKKRISDTKASKASNEAMRMEALKKSAAAVKAGTSNASNANASKPTSMKDMLDQHNARAKSIQTSKDPVAARNAAEKEKQARMESAYTKQLSSAKYSAPTSAPTLLKEEQRAGQEKLANAAAARMNSTGVVPKPASMSQLRAGANAIRGFPQGPKQSPTSIAQQNPLAGKNIKDIRSMGTDLGFPGKKPATINTSRMLTGNPVNKTVRPFSMKTGGKVSSASSRGDGCAIKGKTKGRMV